MLPGGLFTEVPIAEYEKSAKMSTWQMRSFTCPCYRGWVI